MTSKSGVHVRELVHKSVKIVSLKLYLGDLPNTDDYDNDDITTMTIGDNT